MFICPVCGKRLKMGHKTAVCQNGHSFDKAKSGYINLLMSQKSALKRHGDDKLMVKARAEFLERGHYSPLAEKIFKSALPYGKKGGAVLDAGCGECYYSSYLRDRLYEEGFEMEFYGTDISKDALMQGAKRGGGIHLAVASTAHLPFDDDSFDIVINVFSPLSKDCARVLKKDGVLIKAVPRERHLIELKEAVYKNVYLNPAVKEQAEGLVLTGRDYIDQRLELSGEDLQNLFKMTPYYYKTSREGQIKMEDLDSLTVSLEFALLIYKKA